MIYLVEQYIGREIHIANNVSPEHGGMEFWVLTTSAEPCRVLCSCETMGKPAFVRSVKDGNEHARKTTSYVVGSVFTPEQNRGNGYASVMLDLLARMLATECEFDALYSDVGKVHPGLNREILMRIDTDSVGEVIEVLCSQRLEAILV